jgi:hypothetical protein
MRWQRRKRLNRPQESRELEALSPEQCMLWTKLEGNPMKRFLPLLTFMLATMASAEKPNPADYTIAVHVQSSHLFYLCQSASLCGNWQRLQVTIDGKKYELQTNIKSYEVLRVGDYKAKIKKNESKVPYEYDCSYEFLFPDGETRVYAVSGEEE